MKIKLLTISMLLVIGSFTSSFCQGNKGASDVKNVVWLGVDFTAAKFTLVTESPEQIVNDYLKSINMVIITEQSKYDFKKFLKLSEVTNSIDPVNEFNSKIDPSTLVITGDYKLDMDKVKAVIKKYNVNDQSGTGLIFIAENLNKATKTASYYVCFFNLKTKEVIDCQLKSAPVSGIGFRNYWASSVYGILKNWEK